MDLVETYSVNMSSIPPITEIEDIPFADLFCGGGGFTEAFKRYCTRKGLKPRGIAINHWDAAVLVHEANHPELKHLTTDIATVQPIEVFPTRYLKLLVASPECTHHSNARGGKPRDNQSRAQPMLLLDWLSKLYVDILIIENVGEILTWGPLDKNGKPIKSKKGTLFFAWLNMLTALGYEYEWRILNAADYGAATSRKRFFLIARRDGKPIKWPEPTHSRDPEKFNVSGDLPLFQMGGQRKKWRAAREIIDWSMPGKSIFHRKKALELNTYARIARGLRKFSHLDITVDDLVRASHGEHVVVRQLEDGSEPFVFALNHGKDANRSYPVTEPLRTQTTWDSTGLADAAFILPHQHGSNREKDLPRSLDEPMNTLTAQSSDYFLVNPSYVITTGGPEGQGRNPSSVDEPITTVLSEDHHALVTPFLQVYHGTNKPGQDRIADLEEPLGVVDTNNRYGLVEPNLIRYNKTGDNVHSIHEPLHTITTKDRFAMVEPITVQLTNGNIALLDILFRMLQPHELSAAMGFSEGYFKKVKITRKDTVKMIGNAVEVTIAEALIDCTLEV